MGQRLSHTQMGEGALNCTVDIEDSTQKKFHIDHLIKWVPDKELVQSPNVSPSVKQQPAIPPEQVLPEDNQSVLQDTMVPTDPPTSPGEGTSRATKSVQVSQVPEMQPQRHWPT